MIYNVQSEVFKAQRRVCKDAFFEAQTILQSCDLCYSDERFQKCKVDVT